MSASIDFSGIREMTIAFSGLSRMDNEYTFFYDETNNSRLFRITETDFNASKDEDFVLGGLVYEGKHKAFDMEKLLQSLRLQPTMKEVKRKHIAPGNSFLECVNSRKLQTLLEWIIENKIYIHFMAMNNLYYGVVDIVDSLIADTELSGLPWEYITHMKNALYKYINADIAYIHEVFLHYGYPNIADESVREFCEVLIGWIEEIEAENEADDFALESVRQLLKSARKKKNLCFLTDNENLMLMNGYESLYMEPIYMFPNSEHIFDEETEIMKKICSTPIILGGNELHNFSFVKSTENRMVQLSDVIIGIIGKLMLYANVSTLAEIKKEMASLSPQQEKNISLLNNLINASSDHCLAFIHYTANFFEMEKQVGGLLAGQALGFIVLRFACCCGIRLIGLLRVRLHAAGCFGGSFRQRLRSRVGTTCKGGNRKDRDAEHHGQNCGQNPGNSFGFILHGHCPPVHGTL